MKIRLQTINYYYLSFAILWVPLQRGLLNVDGAGRMMFVFTIAVFLINIESDRYFLKKQVFSKPAFFWGLWIIYSAINLQFQGYYVKLSFPFYFIHQLFTPFVVLVVASKETVRNSDGIAKLFTIVFSIYGLLAVTILGGASERHEGRFTGELGNMGPLNIMYIIFFAALLFIKKQIKLKTLIPLIVFAFAAIAMAATRKAFVATTIIMFTLILSQIKLSLKHIILTTVLTIMFYFGSIHAIKNTALEDRFTRGMEVGMEINTTDIKALSYLGDRVYFYINGWDLFTKNPVSGIGLKNFFYKGYGPYVIHSEYIVQLAEGGIIGTVLFFLFYFWIGKRIIRLWRKNPDNSRSVVWLLAGAFGSVLFINFTAWTYPFPQYFAVFGVITGYIKKYETK